MKIAFLSQEVPEINALGGIGFHFLGLAQQLVREGHQVTVFFDGDSSTHRDGIHFIGVWASHRPWQRVLKNIEIFSRPHELLRSCLWGVLASLALEKAQQQHRHHFDIIETHEYHSTPFILAKYAESIVFSLHGGKEQTARLNQNFNTLSQRLLAVLEKRAVQKCQNRYGVSNLQVSLAARYYGISVPAVIPNSVDRELFRPYKGTSPYKQPYWLFVGRIEHRKGISLLLTAYKELVGRYGDRIPDLVCVGADFHHLGLERNLSLQEYLVRPQQKSIAKRIHHVLTASQDQLARYYSHAQCCVFPSLQEPFGNVIAEALSCGAVVITTKTAGISKWLRDEQDAFLTEVTREGIVEALEKILDAQRNTKIQRKLSQLRRQARLTATKYFAQDVVVKQTLRYYRQVLKKVA